MKWCFPRLFTHSYMPENEPIPRVGALALLIGYHSCHHSTAKPHTFDLSSLLEVILKLQRPFHAPLDKSANLVRLFLGSAACDVPLVERLCTGRCRLKGFVLGLDLF